MSPPQTACSKPTALQRLGIAAFVLFIFGALGPPVGALVFLALMSAQIGAGDPGGGFAVFVFTAIFGVPLSYMIGFVPAVLTGAVFALWQAFRGPVSFALAGAIGVASGVVLAATMQPSIGRADGQLSLASVLLTCLAPTLLCWFITRSFAVRR